MVRVRNTCNMPGCKGRVVSNGLCDMHRKRVERHGHTEQTRPSDWGEREIHPLYHTWVWQKRYHGSLLCDEWLDFWKFVKDVGERPSPTYKLRRIDLSKPYSKGNCEWVRSTVRSRRDNLYRRQYNEAYRSVAGRGSDGKPLRITKGQYQKMSKEQQGLCAICGEQEAVVLKTGRRRGLAVDHDHETGKIRGLLCTECNRGLGCFRDSVARLGSAISYLEQPPGVKALQAE